MCASDRPRLLLVHAHPDDETITTGGTIARYVANGAHVVLVTCTLGEEGEVIPPELTGLGSSAGDQLGGYRAAELATALDALGVSEHHYLGGIGRWRDSGMAGTPSADHPRAFVRGDRAQQARQLGEIIAAVRPHVVITYAADGGYGHPDHVRAHEITMAATAEAESVSRVFHTVVPSGDLAGGVAALATVPELPFRLPADGELPSVPDEWVGTAIDITAHVGAKLAGLRAHRTQVSVWQPTDDPGSDRCYALSNGVAQPVLDTEHFVLASGPRHDVAADLFGGLWT